jgi:Rad3-related DNA helicase
LLAWEHWAHLLATLPTCANLGAAPEAEIYDAVAHLANQVLTAPLDYAKLGPQISALLWQAPALLDFVNHSALEKLLHCPRAGELHFTCLDAAPVIGDTLRAFGGVVLMSATLSPVEAVAAACGLDEVGRVVPDEPAPTRLTGTVRPTPPERLGDLNKRETKKLYRHLTSAADLLRVEEERDSARPRFLRAPAPWRDAAYEVAVDIRVETTLRRRGEFYPTTAATVEALHLAALRIPRSAIAIFFPSYAYAEAVQRACAAAGSALRVALQPRLSDLAAQSAWVEESLAGADALFLVLGSSFAEGIDVLGGRVSHALVVGPALPEVNAVQRARLAVAAGAGLSRDAAFRRVYQIPGMIKVNQALGRLVRAPGQRTKVLLHCRRFAEPGYAALLAPEYRQGHEIATDAGLAAWLGAR